MNCADIGPIGVCSWSMNDDLVLLNQLREKTGVEHLHLSLNPLLDGQNDFAEPFLETGWKLSAAMVGLLQENYTTLDSIRRTGGIVPETVWPQNKARLLEAIRITRWLGAPYLEFHFGFIDADDRVAFNSLVNKARQLADAAAENGVVLLMETGQETAATLRVFIETVDHPALAINFDPANMILYGQDNPIEAVGLLRQWIRHVHIKDACPAVAVGQWGAEVPWATGKVNADAFLEALKRIGYNGVLSIEREAGGERLHDIESAISYLVSWSDTNVS